jgi:heme exporter protein D
MEQVVIFFEMGGYGAFVWPAFALTAVIMVTFAVSSLRRLRREQRVLRELEAKAPPRRRDGASSEGEPVS